MRDILSPGLIYNVPRRPRVRTNAAPNRSSVACRAHRGSAPPHSTHSGRDHDPPPIIAHSTVIVIQSIVHDRWGAVGIHIPQSLIQRTSLNHPPLLCIFLIQKEGEATHPLEEEASALPVLCTPPPIRTHQRQVVRPIQVALSITRPTHTHHHNYTYTSQLAPLLFRHNLENGTLHTAISYPMCPSYRCASTSHA